MHFHLNFMTMNFGVCVCVRTHLTCFSINDFRSPLSGLHIRYDSSGPLVPGLGSGSDTLPPVVTSIDQLLDRQWNEGQQFLLQQGSQGDGERLFYTTQAQSCLFMCGMVVIALVLLRMLLSDRILSVLLMADATVVLLNISLHLC